MSALFKAAALLSLLVLSACSEGSMFFNLRDDGDKPRPPAIVESLLLMNRHQLASTLSDIFGPAEPSTNPFFNQILESKVLARGSAFGGPCDIHEANQNSESGEGTPGASLPLAHSCRGGMPETRLPASSSSNPLGAGFISHACEQITNEMAFIQNAVAKVPAADWLSLTTPDHDQIRALWALFYPGEVPRGEVVNRLQAVSAAVASEPTENSPQHQYQALLLTICLTGAWMVL